MSIFKQASREKLRVVTEKGLLTVEQLWDLPVTVLDRTAVVLEKEYKNSGKKSFLEKKSTKNKIIKLKFDIVLEILSAKVEENEIQRTASSVKQHNEKILSLIQDKKEGELKDLSVAELEKLIK